MILAIFARPNHCGSPKIRKAMGSVAVAWRWDGHGYVLALVRCRDLDELSEVERKLRDPPGLVDPSSEWWSEWYGGPMELISVVEIGESKPLLYRGRDGGARHRLVMPSKTIDPRGDQRAVWHLDAAQVLGDAT